MAKIAFVSSELLWDKGSQPFPWMHIALRHLRKAGYTPFIISPESEEARGAREGWLAKHNLAGYPIVLRQPGMDMITIPQWKVVAAKTYVSSQCGVQVESILFIDPDPESHQSIATWNDPRIETRSDLTDFYSEDELR